MSSISNYMADVISVTYSFNKVIDHKLNINDMTEEDVKILRNILIRIRTDTKLLNAIREFNISFFNLDCNCTGGVSATLKNTMALSAKLAHILISIFVFDYWGICKISFFINLLKKNYLKLLNYIMISNIIHKNEIKLLI